MERSVDLMLCFNVPSREDLRTILKFGAPTGVVVNPSHPLAGQGNPPGRLCGLYLRAGRTRRWRSAVSSNRRSRGRLSTPSAWSPPPDRDDPVQIAGPRQRNGHGVELFRCLPQIKDGQLAYLSVLGERLPSKNSHCV